MAVFNNGKRIDGWGAWIGNHILGQGEKYDSSSLGKWYRENYGTNNSFLESLSNDELGALLDDFYTQDSSWSGLDKILGNREILDYNSINKYLSQLQDLDKLYGEMPTAPNLGALRDEAYEKINAENNELLGMLDDDLARQRSLYQSEINDINSMYGDLRRQTLENNYRNNASLMGTVGSEMSKARRNALESGASAGLRLSENINTLLSIQNKQSQQSLETSNQLAQQLLNQRQAAMGVRSAWGQTQSNNTNSKIGIKQGTAERAENYANNRFNTENTVYDNDMQQWEDKYNTATEGNPFADSYRNYYRKNQYGY